MVCHPHPLYGGNMDHPVTVALAEALASSGLVALRFNFRAVGGSRGSHGGGVLEREDVSAALNRAAEEAGADAPLVLAGYSFGAWVAYPMASTDPRVAAVLCVAPPLDLLPMPAETSPGPARWFAQGNRDEFCSPDRFRKWCLRQGDPKGQLQLAGADHFLAGREAEVAAAAAAFASTHVARSQP